MQKALTQSQVLPLNTKFLAHENLKDKLSRKHNNQVGQHTLPINGMQRLSEYTHLHARKASLTVGSGRACATGE